MFVSNYTVQPNNRSIFLHSTAQLGYAKIALALLLRMIFFQKSFAQGLNYERCD